MQIGVIGGGVAGLAAAHHLAAHPEARSGKLEVTLFESAPRLGGKVRSQASDGYLVEWAANGWIASRGTLDLARSLGVSEAVRPAARSAARRYIVRGGRLHLLSPNPLGLLSSPLLSLPGRLRVLLEPFISAGARVPDESVEEFAARRVGPEAARVLASAAVAGIFGGDSREISMASAFPRLSELEARYGSVVKGLSAARRARRESCEGEPSGGGLLSFEGGMEEWARALAAPLGERARVSSKVAAVVEQPRGGVRLELASGPSLELDLAIVATDAGAAAPLVEPVCPETARLLPRIRSAGLAVVALAVPEDAFGAGGDGYGFLVPRGEKLRVLGALWESNLFAGRAPEGQALVRVMLGGARDPEALDLADEELVRIALQDLERAVGLRAAPIRTWVVRQRAGVPQYRVGHAALLAEIDRAMAAHPRVLFTGSSYRGVAVSACMEDGARVAEAAITSLQRR